MLDIFRIGHFVRCKRCGGLMEIIQVSGQKGSRIVTPPDGSTPVADATVEFCTGDAQPFERAIAIGREQRIARGILPS